MRSLRLAAVALLAGGLAACGGAPHGSGMHQDQSSGGTIGASGGSSGSIGTTGGTSSGGSSGTTGGPISVGPSQAMLSVSASITLSGQGSIDVGAISVTNNLGSIEFLGAATPVVAYEIQPFGPQTLYQLIGIQPSNLIVAWVYCEQGAITDVYREDTSGLQVTYETASGTCGDNGTATSVAASLPAFSLAPPAVVSGVTLSGEGLSYDGQNPGSATIGSTTWTLYPFNTVNCESCGTPGWWELHSLFWDATDGDAAFGILYLIDGMSDSVSLDYWIELPNLDTTARGTVFTATWSHP